MFKAKKAQFLVLSMTYLVLLLFLIYYVETENTYIVFSGENHIEKNIILETCEIGYRSNGTQIGPRYENFSNSLLEACYKKGVHCNISIVNNTAIPPEGNYSLLNHTHYDYQVYINSSRLEINKSFTC